MQVQKRSNSLNNTSSLLLFPSFAIFSNCSVIIVLGTLIDSSFDIMELKQTEFQTNVQSFPNNNLIYCINDYYIGIIDK